MRVAFSHLSFFSLIHSSCFSWPLVSRSSRSCPFDRFESTDFDLPGKLLSTVHSDVERLLDRQPNEREGRAVLVRGRLSRPVRGERGLTKLPSVNPRMEKVFAHLHDPLLIVCQWRPQESLLLSVLLSTTRKSAPFFRHARGEQTSRICGREFVEFAGKVSCGSGRPIGEMQDMLGSGNAHITRDSHQMFSFFYEVDVNPQTNGVFLRILRRKVVVLRALHGHLSSLFH